MKNKQNIALIFFSRTSSKEAKYKSWFQEKSKNQSTSTLLINSSERAVQKSGIPVYHFHEKNQNGSTFGERLANAYQEVFALGYEQVISVGNDCPDLDHIDWSHISENLANGKCVLGPDKRGGAYLIGIQKNSFKIEQFEKLNWQKNTLYKELAHYCKDSTKLVELAQCRDINSFHDIRLFLKAKRSFNIFFKFISLLLRPVQTRAFEFQITARNFQIFTDSPLRAPPLK